MSSTGVVTGALRVIYNFRQGFIMCTSMEHTREAVWFGLWITSLDEAGEAVWFEHRATSLDETREAVWFWTHCSVSNCFNLCIMYFLELFSLCRGLLCVDCPSSVVNFLHFRHLLPNGKSD